MMAADRERQQNGAADLPLSFVAMKADRKRDGTDRPTQHDRGNHERGIPQDHALDFEGCHASVVHGSYAAGNDGAPEPRSVAPIRNKRYREPGTREQDRRDQRQHG